MRHWDDYYSGGNHRLLVGICKLDWINCGLSLRKV